MGYTYWIVKMCCCCFLVRGREEGDTCWIVFKVGNDGRYDIGKRKGCSNAVVCCFAGIEMVQICGEMDKVCCIWCKLVNNGVWKVFCVDGGSKFA